MPAVSGVWSCLHYPVPRGGFSPPGLAHFSVYAVLTVNPKSAREIIAVTSPLTLSFHHAMPSSLEMGSVWWGIPGHLEPLPAAPVPIFSSTPPPHPYFPSSRRVSTRSQHKCHSVECTTGCITLVTQLFGIPCARKTVPTRITRRSCKPSPRELFIIRGKTPLI